MQQTFYNTWVKENCQSESLFNSSEECPALVSPQASLDLNIPAVYEGVVVGEAKLFDKAFLGGLEPVHFLPQDFQELLRLVNGCDLFKADPARGKKRRKWFITVT